jgi:predicted small secreted protein
VRDARAQAAESAQIVSGRSERTAIPNISPPVAFMPFLGGSFMRKLVGLVVVAGALMVSACNTVEGAGKDVASAGKTVAKTADSAK